MHKGNYIFSTEAHPFDIDAVRRGGHFAGSGNVNGKGEGKGEGNGDGGGNVGIGSGDVTFSKAPTRAAKTPPQQHPEPQRQQQKDTPELSGPPWTRSKGHGTSSPPLPSTDSAGSRDGASSPALETIAATPRRSSSSSAAGGGDDGVAVGCGGAECGGLSTWAGRRASRGESHHLGPEGWRDPNILLWAQV